MLLKTPHTHHKLCGGILPLQQNANQYAYYLVTVTKMPGQLTHYNLKKQITSISTAHSNPTLEKEHKNEEKNTWHKPRPLQRRPVNGGTEIRSIIVIIQDHRLQESTTLYTDSTSRLNIDFASTRKEYSMIYKINQIHIKKPVIKRRNLEIILNNKSKLMI